jgi:hypothetical protein
MRKTLILTTILLCTALFGGSGCMKALGRTVDEMKGASSDYEQVPGTGVSSFAGFNGVTVEPVQTELGGLVPPAFKAGLMTALRKELTQDKDAPFRSAGTPSLSIEPHVMWFNKGGSVFPEKHAIVLYYLKGNGADMGRVQIMTKSEASHTGDEGLAESNAKELAKYFNKHGRKKK